jgi:Rrf2 family transcriptional regulator, iron-sulfur cluster assembly transcription factor
MQLLPPKAVLAVAAVIDIALNARGRPVAAKALATRHGLSPRHLEPVLQALVRHGILKGTRGPRGGYELAREARRITADDILRATTGACFRRVVASPAPSRQPQLGTCFCANIGGGPM